VYWFSGSADIATTIAGSRRVISDTVDNSHFGAALASVDLDGDGTRELIISRSALTGSTRGTVSVLRDGSDGFDPSPVATWTGDTTGPTFGLSVAAAGDVNSDGMQDLLIGDPLGGAASSPPGRASLVLGQRGVISTVLSESRVGSAPNQAFGSAVIGLGDVNGDGLDDIAVGAPLASDGAIMGDGAVTVFAGTRMQAVLAQNSTPFRGELAGDWFGYRFGSGGDVNGDGYQDMVVGAPWRTDGARGRNSGALTVLFGSPTGLSLVGSWSAYGMTASEFFGLVIAK
jgi:hypothetical protein